MESLEVRCLLSAPEIDILNSNGTIQISNGDTTPAVVDGTDYSNVNLGSVGSSVFAIRNIGTAVLNLTNPGVAVITGDPDFKVRNPPPPATVNSFTKILLTIDFLPTTLGLHTATVTIPSDDADENPYTFTIQGTGGPVPQPDLIFEQPAGWPDKMVISTNTGDNVDDAPLYSSQNLYMDFSVKNIGTKSAGIIGMSGFLISLRVDGTDKMYWSQTALAAGASAVYSDINIGTLSAGSHVLMLLADSDIMVTESDETNNFYTRAITVLAPPAPDLTFVQQSGWSDKLVISTNAGDNLDDSPIYSNQGIYVDCAVSNAGTAGAGSSLTRLLVDGIVRNTWTTASLAIGAQTTYLDFNLGTLPAGTHTIQVVADAGGTVAESNETNNNRTRTITVLSPPAPEMAVMGGAALDVEIVDGDSSPIATDRTDFGNLSISASPLVYTYKIKNTGTATLNLTGTPRVAISGSTAFTVSSQPAVASLGAGGETTFAIAFDPSVLGANNATVSIANDDSNENPYNFSITGYGLPATAPDLTIYQPAGWQDKVVVSTNAGDHVDDAVIYSDQDIFLDYGIANIGTGNAGAFATQCFVDGVLKNSWPTSSLAAGANAAVSDYNIGKLSAGAHSIKFTVDAAGAITESNEGNNNRTRAITVLTRGQADLNLALPAGWSDKMIVSTTGDNLDDSPIYNDQNIYIDFAVANIGSADAGTSTTQLWVDGSLKDVIATSAITRGSQQLVSDRNIGKLSAGTHTLQLRADGTNVIAESNEGNNNRTRTITVLPRTAADLTMALPAGWSDKLIVSTNAGDNADDSPLYNDQNLYIDLAIGNIGSADAGGFITSLYVDGVLKQSWTTVSLAAGTQRLITDFNLGKLSAGSHTLKLTADSTGLISELNELNNNRTRLINVLAR